MTIADQRAAGEIQEVVEYDKWLNEFFSKYIRPRLRGTTGTCLIMSNPTCPDALLNVITEIPERAT